MSAPERAEKPLPPVVRSIRVGWPPEAAFRRFTAEIATWWPLRTHSVGQDRAEAVVFEGRAGGRIFEKIRGGEESVWGTVTAWDPPRRVAFTWHPGLTPENAGDIELRFLYWAGQGSGLFVRSIDALSWATRPLQRRMAAKMQAQLDASRQRGAQVRL